MLFSMFKKFLYPLILLGTINLVVNAALAAEQLHFVIDISGSMQKVDPKKERFTALQQFVNELPPESKAGIWTYAGQVNNLVPQGTANTQWKSKASTALGKLGGYGPYANLPLALSQATYDWRSTPNKSGRNIILITDNGVKNSDNAEQNKIAAEKLTQDLLPQLEKSGVKLHIIALKDADTDLLQKLATATAGELQQLTSPSEFNSALDKLANTLGITRTAAIDSKTEPETTSDTASSEVSVNQVLPAESPDAANGNESLALADANVASASETSTSPSLETVTVPAEQITQSTTTVEPAAGTLGEAESDEIRAALAKAETELQDLLQEYSAENQTDQSPAAALSGQQLSQPLVITLNDGSVLVTSNETKAKSMAEQSMPTDKNTQEAPSNMDSSAPAAADPEGIIYEGDENVAPVEWPVANTQSDIWPLVLTILAVINIGIIVLLFAGRYLWMRHKRKLANI